MPINLQATANALKKQKSTQLSPTTQPNIIPTPTNNSLNTTQINMQELQDSIKIERKFQKMTQRQLASEANISQGTITRAERHGWVSIYTLMKIANALGKKLTIT